MAQRNTDYKGKWLLAIVLGVVIAVEGSTHKGEVQMLIGISGVLIGCVGYLGLLRISVRTAEAKGKPVRLPLLVGFVAMSVGVFALALAYLVRKPGYGFIAIPLSLLLVALFWTVCIAFWQIIQKALKR